HDYATGRPLRRVERMMFAAAARDARTAHLFEAIGTRQPGARRNMARIVPRALAVNVRHALAS
ncbi:MAG TPA: NAD(P)/FAD-dependent oxidoreductase, partial [Solirubrobacterales bacterium]